MQFSPLFLPMLNSSENSGDLKSFKLSNSTYLFADIMEVHIDSEMNKTNELNTIDTPQINAEDFLNFSISPDLKPVTNPLNTSFENQIFTIDLKSLAGQIEQLSYPLSKKELFKHSAGEPENIEDKKFLSGVEINEIIKKIAYLTGAINYNQFFSNDENSISVKNNKGEEVQLSVKEILNIINSNKETSINLENDTQTLKIELTKKEFSNPEIQEDFVFFSESDDNPEFSLLKTEIKNNGNIPANVKDNSIVNDFMKTGLNTDNKTAEVFPGKTVSESINPKVNIGSKDLHEVKVDTKISLDHNEVKIDNKIKETFLGKQSAELSSAKTKPEIEIEQIPKIKPGNSNIKTNPVKVSSEVSSPKVNIVNKDFSNLNAGLKDLQKSTPQNEIKSNPVKENVDFKNQVYEVKLEVITKTSSLEQIKNDFRITNKLIGERAEIKLNPKENVTNNRQDFLNEIKDVIEEYPKITKEFLKTPVQDKTNNPGKQVFDSPFNNEKVNEVEKVVSNSVNKNLQVNADEEIVSKESIPVAKSVNEKSVIGNKNQHESESKIPAETKNVSTVQPNNSEPTIKVTNELKYASQNVVSIESLNKEKLQASNKISEPEKPGIKLSDKVEKESNPKQAKEDLNRDQMKQQQDNSGLSFNKIVDRKFQVTRNAFIDVQDSIKTITASEIVKEFTNLVENADRKSVVLKLSPENLGKVKISLDVTENNVRANFEVENESVKTLIQNNSENLKQALIQQGLLLNTMNISLSGHEQKPGKSFSSKRKSNDEDQLKELDEAVGEKISKKLGYNTYEYLV